MKTKHPVKVTSLYLSIPLVSINLPPVFGRTSIWAATQLDLNTDMASTPIVMDTRGSMKFIFTKLIDLLVRDRISS